MVFGLPGVDPDGAGCPGVAGPVELDPCGWTGVLVWPGLATGEPGAPVGGAWPGIGWAGVPELDGAPGF